MLPRLYFTRQENVTELSIEILNENWSFCIHYFLPEMGQAFFLHLFLFYDMKGYCRCFIQEL